MSAFPNLPNAGLERAQDLLIARGTIGLSAAEAVELNDLLATLGMVVGPEEIAGLDRAVEATRRAVMTPTCEAMPAGLCDRIAAMPRPEVSTTDSGPVARIGPAIPPARGGAGRGVWAMAAAMLLAGAMIGFLMQRSAPSDGSASLAAVDRAPDAVRLPFASKVAEYNGVSGEVVWSESLQRGYMRFKGLAANDPRIKQYQLWIVDPKRDQHPVDGGVFDIAQAQPDGNVLVPFRSVLHVDHPAAFAVTAEKPGGVVVSAGPLLLVAAK